MEIYILDDLYRRIKVVDKFESLIWTERWRDVGDFELILPSTLENRHIFEPNMRLAMSESDRVMIVETIDDKTDAEGKSTITVKGPSYESVLDDRVATDGFAGTTLNPNWSITGTPGYIAREVFNQICIVGLLSPGDILQFVSMGSIYPPSTIEEPTTSVTIDIAPDTVLKAIKDICDVYDLGFRIVRNGDTSELYFDVYTGNDHTSLQIDLPVVVFSPDFGNLSNTSEYVSISKTKNVAYVIAKNGSEVVYGNGADATTSGSDRRVLLVKADDVDEAAGPALTAILQKKGADELAKSRSISAFDGEIRQFGDTIYGVHYGLGDLVEMKNTDGATNNMRVTEQIFVSDHEGERSYPTLSLELYITPGSWLAEGNETWDGGDEGHWDDD
jgi:hypothetical protein